MNRETKIFYIILLIFYASISIWNIYMALGVFTEGFNTSNILSITFSLLFATESLKIISILLGKRKNIINISIEN